MFYAAPFPDYEMELIELLQWQEITSPASFPEWMQEARVMNKQIEVWNLRVHSIAISIPIPSTAY